MTERQEVEERSRKVDGLTSSRNYAEAVMTALKNPPLSSQDQYVKDMNYQTVLRALAAVREKEIEGIVGDILGQDDEIADNLMRYLYRALSEEKSNGTLFTWHKACVDVAGSGCILRAITDRKTV